MTKHHYDEEPPKEWPVWAKVIGAIVLLWLIVENAVEVGRFVKRVFSP